MRDLRGVSGFATTLVVLGILIFVAGLIALPYFGIGVYVGIAYSGVALVAAGVIEERAHRRHLEILRRLNEIREQQPQRTT